MSAEKRELAPFLIKFFIENEVWVTNKIEEGNRLNEHKWGFRTWQFHAPDGTVSFEPRDFNEFLRNKDLYTSPLYKALL